MLKFMIPLLAVLNCVQITDNTWTCTADDSGFEDLYPVVPDPSSPGTYTCTNCTAITPSECEEIKSSLQSRVQSIFFEMQSPISRLAEAKSALLSFKSQLEEFQICPYTYTQNGTEVNTQPGYDSSLPTVASRYSDLWSKMSAAWYGSQNYQTLNISLHDPSAYNTTGMQRSINYLVGVWECSYTAAQQSLSSLSTIEDHITNSVTRLNNIMNVSIPSLQAQISSVTCDTCSLTPSSGSGDSGESGETGTETGCLTCYTDYLSSIEGSVDSINQHVQQINTNLSAFILNVTDSIKDNLDIPLSSISNVVQRIDDYLRVDQDQLLDSIRSAVIVISNEVSDIQHDFYAAFKRADESKNFDDEEFDLVEAINEIPQGGDSVWSRLNWFSRMEALLGSIAGFGTNTTDVSTEIPSEFLQEYDTNISSVNSDSSGLAARDQISGAMDTISSVLDSFRIFDGVYEPESIRLLDSSELPFLSGDNGAHLTVEIPEVPAIYSFLRFARYAFTALYWSAALLAFFFALLGLYTGVVSLIKWASQFLGSVFSS